MVFLPWLAAAPRTCVVTVKHRCRSGLDSPAPAPPSHPCAGCSCYCSSRRRARGRPAAPRTHGARDSNQDADRAEGGAGRADRRALETRIRQLWFGAGWPAASAPLTGAAGQRDLQNDADDAGSCRTDFDAVLALEPKLADAYYRRALARFHLGNYPGALADIETTLKLEPRHFPALMSLSRIAVSRNDFKGALAAWKKVLELSPNTPDGQDRLKLLQKKALGEEL